MRGEFIRGDGLVIPNNISKAGAQMILAAAFRNDVPTFYCALVAGVPTPTMTMLNMTEPTIGLNGYARISIPRNDTGWPNQDESGGERFIESQFMAWAASGGNFSHAIRRLALIGTSVYSSADPVYCLSAALPADLTITPTTPLDERRFKYRVYI